MPERFVALEEPTPTFTDNNPLHPAAVVRFDLLKELANPAMIFAVRLRLIARSRLRYFLMLWAIDVR